MASAQHPTRLVARRPGSYKQAYRTQLGALYGGDCVPFLKGLPTESVDMIFADPPFNLGKNYGAGISDAMRAEEYLDWSKEWLRESVRILTQGGALLVFNLPRWLISYGSFLNDSGMQFRHWIAMRMPKAYPRGPRLSPAHYGCLYYTKGLPRTFNKVYVPIPTCRHCGGEIRDYGGHRKALNQQGLNFMDVIDSPQEVWVDAHAPLERGEGWTLLDELWEDVPPVRHGAYKVRGANELAPIMLERLIALSTTGGDLLLDPFGGSGTTYYAAEKLGRRWLGIEIGDVAPAIRRLKDLAAGRHPEWESARGNGHKPPPEELQLIGLRGRSSDSEDR